MKRRIINILAAAAAVLSAAACNGLKETDLANAVSMSIKVEPDSLLVKAEGENATFTFNAPDYWFASCPADWVTIEPASGKPGEVTVTVKPTQNTGSAERSAFITVNSKTQRGQFKIKQEAWPYTSSWTIKGSINGGTSVTMTDQGDGLVWKAEKVAFHAGETFKFGMGKTELGMDGTLAAAEDGTYGAAVKKGGADIVLPEDGYWDITLDMNNWTVSAAMVERYPWTIIGTLDGSNWDKDFTMEDKGSQLLWEAAKLAYNEGEVFKFRREANNNLVLGIDGNLAAVEGSADTYTGALKKDGADITLPKEGYWKISLDVAGNSITAEFVEDFPIPVETEGTVIFDKRTLFDSWNATIEIPGEKFATAEVGDLIRVYFGKKESSFNPVFKHMDWTDWPELQNSKADGENYFEATIPAEALDELKTDGLRFQGVGFTLLAVTLIHPLPAGQTLLFDTETVFDSWNATAVVPAEKFANAEAGDIIRVNIKDKTSDYNPLFKHVGNWGDWTELQNTKTDGEDYFECTIAAEALDELKTDGLRFQGVGFTLVSVVLIQEVVLPSEYDIAPFTVYEDRSASLEYPYYPDWGNNSGKLRVMRGGTPAIENLGLTTSSKFVIYKEVGTTGQLQFNDANWDHDSLAVTCNDWNGDAATIEVPFNEAMLKCVTGETADGWSQTAFIIQGDGLTITKIVIVP